jgi:hypothetical protein
VVAIRSLGFQRERRGENLEGTKLSELSIFPKTPQIINLVGDPSQQDIELSALYRDSIGNYGEGKVLGILATKYDPHDHYIHKRQAPTEPAPTEGAPTTENPNDDPVQDDYIYNAAGKIILYTTSAPVIKFPEDKNGTELKAHLNVNADVRDTMNRLIVPFKTDDGKVGKTFAWPIAHNRKRINFSFHRHAVTICLEVSLADNCSNRCVVFSRENVEKKQFY